MLPFKKGGFIMALTAQAPIVPVAIHGRPGRDAEGQLPCLAGEGAHRPRRADRDQGPNPPGARSADRRNPRPHCRHAAQLGRDCFNCPWARGLGPTRHLPAAIHVRAIMDTLVFLGRTLGFSVAAGVNLYATIALIGLASRFGWVALPPEYAIFDSDWVIGAALLLYAVEFIADKVLWVDTLWDTVHTFIRPLGGAAVAVASLGDASPGMTALVALIGGTVAAGAHATKAGTRVIVNTSPEPFSNWIVSLAEDGFVLALGFLALKYPLAALIVSSVVIVGTMSLVVVLVRAFRRRFGTKAATAP